MNAKNACPECGVDVNELTAEIDRLRDELFERTNEATITEFELKSELENLREELLKLQGDCNILREALIELLERDRRRGLDA